MFDDIKSLPRKMKNIVNGSLLLSEEPKQPATDNGNSTFQNTSEV